MSEALSKGEVTSTELTQAHLDRIAGVDSSVKAFLHVDAEGALAQAARVDADRSAGKKLHPLAGIPLALKDVLTQEGIPTTAGSKILQGWKPQYDSTVVSKIKDAGIVILGKTNMDEFAMGSSTENSAYGPTFNPWDLSRTCGGSSGGSAAVVAAGFSPVSIGTDTGGSIRQPAAFCGVCGLKPTYGRVSRYGLVAYASSLDQAGPFGNTVSDLAIMLETIGGHDCRDSTSLNLPLDDYSNFIENDSKTYTIGIVPEHLDSPGLDPEIKQSILQAIDVYKKLGFRIVDVVLPHHRYAIPTYYIVAPSEASSNLSRFDGAHYGFRATVDKTTAAGESALVAMYKHSRSQGFGIEVKRRIMLGTYTLSAGYYDAYYLKALRVRRLIRNDYDRAFESVDAILGPTTPTPAFRLGEKVNDPVQMYLEDLYTVSANLAGIPAVSIPNGLHSTGLPLGMQLQGAPLSEAKLLSIANAFHRETSYQPRIAFG